MLDAAVALAVPLGVLVLAAIAVWALSGGAGLPWTAAAQAGADLWLLGHGVDLTVALPGTAPFVLSIAALGGAFATLVLGFRAGRRQADTRGATLALVLGVVTAAVIGALTGLLAATRAVAPSVVQSAVLPAVVYGIGVAGALVRSRAAVVRRAIAGSALRAGLRAGAGAAVAVLGAGALGVAVLLAVHLGRVVGLAEALQAGGAGGLALTVAQLLLLPTLVVWGAAWLLGPGFALGAGSSLSPLGTLVGPVPALPVFGALPADPGAAGLVVLVVPVVAGFVTAHLAAWRAPARPTGPGILGSAAAAAVTGAVVLGVLAAAASGGLGPGRLADAGPDALRVALAAAAELFVASLLGFWTAPTAHPTPEGAEEATE